MDEGVYLVIENERAMAIFIRGAVKHGYLRRFDLRDVSEWIKTTEYPVKAPVKLEKVISMGGNDFIKGLFGKSIDRVLTKWLKEAMGISED